MSSLAHEGNPKEDEITISGGSVLSTAQLDIDFQFLGGTAPNVPSVADSGITQRVQTCGDVFRWTGMESGIDIMYLFQNVASGSCIDRYNDQTLDLTINSSPDCYGVVSQKYWPINLCNTTSYGPVLTVWQVQFSGIVSGTPIAGIALTILDDMTDADNVQVYALVIDTAAGNVKLCRWNNESLGDLTTPLETISVMPNPGDSLWLQSRQHPDDIGNNYWYGAVKDSAEATRGETSTFLLEDVPIAIGNRVRHSRQRVGFVSIGGPTSSGIMKFTTKIGSYLTALPWLESTQEIG